MLNRLRRWWNRGYRRPSPQVVEQTEAQREYQRQRQEALRAFTMALVCDTCGQRLSGLTFENDYMCDPCGGFVNARHPTLGLIRGHGRGTIDEHVYRLERQRLGD